MNRIFALLAVVISGCGGSRAADAIGGILAEHLAGTTVTGATGAVILPDGTQHAGAWGAPADEPGAPLPEPARMLAGSVGKTFFAVVLLQLIEEGRLSLDDPLSEYLGKADWFGDLAHADAITLRNLANHTSGLRDHVWFDAFQDAIREDPARVWSHDELARQIAGSEPLFEPGDAWAYSDSNYVLLGLAIERATGRDACELIGERILTPLGLDETSPSDRAELPGLVAGTTGLGEVFGIGPVVGADSTYDMNPQWEWAGGGMISTSADLAMFFHAIFTSDLLAPASRDELLRFVPAQLGPGSGYSVGVIRMQTPAGEGHGHLGIMPGYLTFVMHYPEHGVTVAVQVNSDDGAARAAQLAAASAIAAAAFERAKPHAAEP